MPSLIYAVDGMDAIKLVDEVFACLDSLLEVRIGQWSSLLSAKACATATAFLIWKQSAASLQSIEELTYLPTVEFNFRQRLQISGADGHSSILCFCLF
jgi:hypothetical protein